MIERDPIALSACGVHVRRFDGAGGEKCPLGRAMLHAARTEPLMRRTHTNAGKPIVKSRREPLVGGEPRAARPSSPWRGRQSMPKSERSTALYTKSGAPVGARGRG